MRAAPHVRLPHQSGRPKSHWCRISCSPCAHVADLETLRNSLSCFSFSAVARKPCVRGGWGKSRPAMRCKMASGTSFNFRLCQEKTPDPFYSTPYGAGREGCHLAAGLSCGRGVARGVHASWQAGDGESRQRPSVQRTGVCACPQGTGMSIQHGRTWSLDKQTSDEAYAVMLPTGKLAA